MSPQHSAEPQVGRPLQALDLVALARQLERDTDLGWQDLQVRDAAIGARCEASDDESRLRFWLQTRCADDPDETATSLDESALSWLFGVLFALLGVFTMTGFLWANRPDNLVNVLLFFFLFVFVQLMLSLLSAATLWSAAAGRRPPALVLNPARWVVQRYLPAHGRSLKYLPIVQLLALRLGQLAGVAFVSATLLAYVLAPAFNDSLSFGWSASWITEERGVAAAAGFIGKPWEALPGARPVTLEDVSATYFESGQGLRACAEQAESRCRALSRDIWGAFLGLSILVYALLPRALLWLVAGRLYRLRLQRAFTTFPGAELVLRRMQQAPVHTQGESRPRGVPEPSPSAPLEGTVLISWSDAIGPDELGAFSELEGLQGAILLDAGLSFEQDQAALRSASQPEVQLRLLLVKSWEPPMSDLADFVSSMGGRPPCVVFLRPLNGQDIPSERLDDWKAFAATLPEGVQVKALNPVPVGSDA